LVARDDEDREFICAVCKGFFIKARNTAEAIDEMLDTWVMDDEQMSEGFDEVCDDCFRLVKAWAEQEGGMLR